ncbi:MAG: pentapeptide repeat-containing protein, partial [Chloroflexi bacterium]|nr:pentapeptide repeat-containing protein [Chloroflexota bacterium]
MTSALPEEWNGLEYTDHSFEDAALSGVDMRKCSFLRCRFAGSKLIEARTYGCRFEDCDFSRARLNCSEHRTSSFTSCSFRRSSLFMARFEECKLTGANVTEADLSGL